MVAGKRNQVERSGFKTKSEATKAMNEVIYHYNMTGDFVENKKITFEEVYNEFIEKEASATRAYATVVRYKSLYRNHLQKPFDIFYMYQITTKIRHTNLPAVVRRTELTSTYLSKNCWSCVGNYLAEN